MALEMIAWAGRHIDALFIVGLAIIGIRFVAECVSAVYRGVERYRVFKADAALRRIKVHPEVEARTKATVARWRRLGILRE